jgi:hypothetical protein
MYEIITCITLVFIAVLISRFADRFIDFVINTLKKMDEDFKKIRREK